MASALSPRAVTREDLEVALEYERRTKEAALERLQALLAVAKSLKDQEQHRPRGHSQSGQNPDPSLRPPGAADGSPNDPVTPRSRGTQSGGGWQPASRTPSTPAPEVERLQGEVKDLRERNLKLQSDLEKALKLLKEIRAKKTAT